MINYKADVRMIWLQDKCNTEMLQNNKVASKVQYTRRPDDKNVM